MLNNILFLLCFVSVGVLFSAPEASAMDWLAYGDLRGYIEPCGCDPTADLGGVERLAQFLEEKEKLYEQSIVFDLGNNFSPLKKDLLKNKFISKSLARIKPDVSLLNVMEINNKELLIDSSRYVLSNSNPHTLRKISFSEVVEINGVAVYGYVWHESIKNKVTQWGPLLRKKWQKKLSAYHDKKKVLLYSGTDKSLEKIIKSKLFDLVISSNRKPFGSIIDNDEERNPGQLLRVASGVGVYQVPIGGQGVLLGGQYREKIKIDLDPKLSKLAAGDVIDESMIFKKTEKLLVQWLRPTTILPSNPVNSVMREYNAEVKKNYISSQKLKLANLINSQFVGAKKCKSCHNVSFKVWEKSHHAKAYATLVAKNKHQNAECVSCHVVGFFEKGGFISTEKTPKLINVQCENCHGSGKKHSKDPRIKMPRDSKKVCVSCHMGAHSPEFDFERYWDKIKHDE